MKTLPQMLRELARQDVSEFAVVSGRLPCIKVSGRYEPIDDRAPTTEEILELLVSTGGGRYLDDVQAQPAAWTTRVEGLGSIGIQVIERDGRLQARFTVVRRPSAPAPAPAATAPNRRPTPPPARAAAPARPRSHKSIPAARVPAEEVALDQASEPQMRAVPVGATGAAGKALAISGPARTPLDALLWEGCDSKASDVHVVAGRPLLLRLGGALLTRGPVLDAARVDEMVSAVVPERVRARLAEQGSCDFAIERPDLGRFRVNVSRQRTGLKACFRIIRREVPTLASLGLPPEIEKATHHHQGLVVVTGPTGHGKTCTLGAIVDILNRDTTHHIITVEDPVEIVHPRKRAMVSQREVGSCTRSFAAALKGSLREDPDVIVVGELRDTETVRMALAASETGHLVLGTMNTPNAAKTIDRLIDLFPPGDQPQVRMTLSGGLHLIVSQRLLPAADGSGVVAAVELLPGSIALWSLIRDNKTFQIPSLQQRGKGYGILRLDESLYDLVRAGRTTKESALAVAENPEELDAWLTGKRPAPGAVAAAPGPPPKPEPASPGLLGKAGQLFGRKGG